MLPTRIRIAGDPLKISQGFLNELNRGATPAFWRGNALRIEFAILAGAVLADLANVASVTCRVKPSQAENETLMSKTIFAGDLDGDVTLAEWQAGSAQHGVIEFTPGEANLPLADKARRCVWMVLVATLDDDSIVTLAAGRADCIEANDEAGDPPPGYPDPVVLPGPPGATTSGIQSVFYNSTLGGLVIVTPDGSRFVPVNALPAGGGTAVAITSLTYNATLGGIIVTVGASQFFIPLNSIPS